MLRLGRSDEKYYMEGACPFFALAAHRLTGWPIAVLTDEEAEWESFGSDKEYPLIAHVFVVTPDGMAFDAKGIRSIEDVKNDFHDLQQPTVEETSVKGLRSLMGDFRPLCRYSSRDLREAEDAVLRLLRM